MVFESVENRSTLHAFKAFLRLAPGHITSACKYRERGKDLERRNARQECPVIANHGTIPPLRLLLILHVSYLPLCKTLILVGYPKCQKSVPP